MRHTPTRSIPPPIDLSVSGSNIRGSRVRGTSGSDRVIGGYSPSVFEPRYIIEMGDGTSPVPTSTPQTVNFSSSLTPGSSTQGLNSWSPLNEPKTSISSGSLLSPSEWNNTKLVPNRRRRSYSEGAYSPDSPSSTRRSVSDSTCNGRLCTPKTNEFPTSADSRSQTHSLRSGASLAFSFRNKSEVFHSEDLSAVSRQQRPSKGGRRSRLWSSIAHLPLSAGLIGSWDFRNRGDNNTFNIPRKAQRPGTSASTSSSWAPFSDVPANGGSIGRVPSFKKRQRPSTASSVTSAPSVPSPARNSKLDWHKQWKRFSRLRSSSSSISISVQTSPSAPSLQSSSSPLSVSPSNSISPSSPSPQPTTLNNSTSSKCLRTWASTKNGISESTSLALPSSNSRNRSTPNLQASGLSMEDLGKINAFFAPPPPAHTVQALSEKPRPRAVSSGPKMKPRLPLPPEIPELPSRRTFKASPVPIQSSVSVSTQKASKNQGIPIALPLPPNGSVGCDWDSEEDIGVIYLTVEDVLDEESGEAMLRLVEIPK